MFLLAQHSPVAERVYQECQEVLGNERPESGDLTQLTYLENVIKEALRLYPPVYGLFREPTMETEIGGYDIPAGSTVVLAVFAVQRDERWYDNPETFDPDRWRGESNGETANPNFAYCPFGGGPNICVGETFANAELKTVIATILPDWKLRAVTEEFERVIAITAQPRNELLVEVSQR